MQVAMQVRLAVAAEPCTCRPPYIISSVVPAPTRYVSGAGAWWDGGNSVAPNEIVGLTTFVVPPRIACMNIGPSTSAAG